MINRMRILVLIIICALPSILYSQRGKFYSTTDAELSCSLINQLYQDSDGYIWIATEYGLNKFDGNSFFTYKHNDSNAKTLKNNYVTSLFQDSYGNMYVGCVNGLMRYNKKSDSFFEIKLKRGNDIISTNVMDFFQFDNGDVLIATAGYGIFRLKKGEETALSDEKLNKGLPDEYTSVLFMSSDNTLWIGTENKGVVAFTPQGEKKAAYSYPALTDNNISSIAEDKDGNIIIGTLNKGINVYNIAHNTFTPVHGTNNYSIKHISRIGSEVYVGTDGQGIKKYADNQLTDLIINGSPYDLNNAKVHYILSDRDNNLWIGIFQKGIVFIPNRSTMFNYWGHRSLTFNPIGNGCVMSIYCDSNNDIWVGCDSQGIYQLDKNGNRKNHFIHNVPNDAPNIPLCMFEDSDHNFWVGSYAEGVAIMDRKSGKCNYLPELRSQKIYCITEDHSKNVYIATLGNGFYMYSLKDRTLKQYKFKNKSDKEFVFNDWINYILYDSNGYLWIAHYSGVSCFDINGKKFVDTPISKATSRCIVYSLLRADNGDLYAGTSNGLFIMSKDKSQIRRYSLDEGLANEIICALAEDKSHNIWMSTYMGISKYMPQSDKFINYYTGDGIQGNEFTHGAFYKDVNGTIYFGGVNGITSFSAKDRSQAEANYDVYITGFSVFDKRINSDTKSGDRYIINTSVSQANEFILSYKDNTFTIDLSTLSYVNPERIVYQYRIAELDRKWLSTAPGVNKITFNALPPGQYTFEVKAEVQGYSSKVKKIMIIITPPWYGSWWAYCLYMFVAALFLYLIIIQYRSRQSHKREIMKREHAEQINEAKLQFFINISHEIRTPMTLIISPLEKLISEVEDKPLKQTYLMIYRNSQRILRLINQLMDIRKIDKGQFFLKFRETDLVGFINDVKLTFDYKARQKHIDFTFTHSMDKLKVWIDLNNFDKIMMNLLSNAFKFTPDNGSIGIDLTTGTNERYKGALKRYFQITITDSGIGLDREKIDKIFERFYQIDNDVTQSNFGTGIGLHMCKSLVELHHGIIIAQNREDTSGSQFIIRIPMGSDHLKKDEIEITDSEVAIPKISIKNEMADYDEAPQEEEVKEKKGRKKVRKTILIIEDDDEIRNYIKEELQDEFAIIMAHDGKEGYNMVLNDMPELIISDVMMPEMDGLTLCRKIKQNNNINQIPIILLTAKTKTEDQIEGMETGADAYIVKPFNMDILRSKVVNLIENRELLKNKYVVVQNQLDKVDKIEMKSSDEVLMSRIMKIINQHMDDPGLNVELLASEVGMSRVHMHRKLKELTNMSARDFIRTIRLKQAAELLREKKLTISEVAYAVGYTNPSYFSNSFKEYFGAVPKEYMLRSKEDQP